MFISSTLDTKAKSTCQGVSPNTDVNSVGIEASAGDILVIKAGEVHSFKKFGDTPLVQLDVHLSPRFIQETI